MINRKVTWPFFMAVLLVFFFVAQGLAQESPAAATSENCCGKCSLATLKGSYGVLEQGTVVGQIPGFPPPPWPVVNSVLATYDGAGNVKGTYTASFGGVIGSGTFTGTYKVKPDCTYSTEFTAGPLGVLHETGTITGRGMFQELHLMYTDPFLVATGTAKKIAPEGCSLATFKGKYALFGEGTITGQIPGFPPPPFPAAHIGIFAADGAGNFSGADTNSIAGMVVPGTFTGTYTVDPDCTESATITTSLGLVVHEAGTITGPKGHQEIHKIVTDAGWVFADTAKRQ
jgi:hypothetical protein